MSKIQDKHAGIFVYENAFPTYFQTKLDMYNFHIGGYAIFGQDILCEGILQKSQTVNGLSSVAKNS